MVTMMDKKKILDLKTDGMSNREVARQLGIDRKTVAKYWNRHQKLLAALAKETDSNKIKKIQEQIAERPKYDSTSRTVRLLTSNFYRDLENILNSEVEKEKLLGTKKQNLTKRQIHKKMKSYGHNVGYSTVCFEIDKMRNKNRECYIRQKYNYGDRLEYDFGEVHLFIAGETKTLNIAVFSSPASNFKWCYLYENQKQDVFLDSHVKFFEMTKGVWKEIVYDNMRNVVKRFIGKNKKELNEELVKLATYYGFKINVTNAYKGNEKGHVENSVKQLRNRIFAEQVKFKDLKEASNYMTRRLFEINTQSKISSELSALTPAPPKYEIANITYCKVDKYSLIQVACNKYSVPDYLVGHKVTVKIYHDKILVYCNNDFVCEHVKLKGKKKYSIEFKHYLQTLIKKPAAVKNSLALKSNHELNKVFCKYYFENPKEFVELIDLYKKLSWDNIIFHLVEAAKDKLIKYQIVRVQHKINRPNTLGLKTQKIMSNYKNLVIGG